MDAITKGGEKKMLNELKEALSGGDQDFIDEVVVEILTQGPLANSSVMYEPEFQKAVKSVRKLLATRNSQMSSKAKVRVAVAWFWYITALLPNSGSSAGEYVYWAWMVLQLSNEEFQEAFEGVDEDSKSDLFDLTDESVVALEWVRHKLTT